MISRRLKTVGDDVGEDSGAVVCVARERGVSVSIRYGPEATLNSTEEAQQQHARFNTPRPTSRSARRRDSSRVPLYAGREPRRRSERPAGESRESLERPRGGTCELGQRIE